MMLTEYLAQAQFAKTKYARVSLVLDVDTGRSGETNYAFRILAPKSITNVVNTSKNYTFTVYDGNPLNTKVPSSVLDVKMDLPEQGSQIVAISFDLVLDGKPFTAKTGQAYIFAVRQDGPRTVRNPYLPYTSDTPYSTRPSNEDDQYDGPRMDLHTGNEFDDPDSATAPDDDIWLRSGVSDIEISLVDPGATDMSTKQVYNQGSFSSS